LVSFRHVKFLLSSPSHSFRLSESVSFSLLKFNNLNSLSERVVTFRLLPVSNHVTLDVDLTVTVLPNFYMMALGSPGREEDVRCAGASFVTAGRCERYQKAYNFPGGFKLYLKMGWRG
jgi:hypothetical protein